MASDKGDSGGTDGLRAEVARDKGDSGGTGELRADELRTSVGVLVSDVAMASKMSPIESSPSILREWRRQQGSLKEKKMGGHEANHKS